VVTSTPAYGEYGPCYVLTGSSMQTLAAPAGQGCRGEGLSDTGVAAGNVWNNSAPYGSSPARWVNGVVQVLPSLPATPSNPMGSAQVNSINKDSVIVGEDQGKPVRWINGVEQVLTTPITGLPAGAALAGVVDISDTGLLLVQFHGSSGRSFGVLSPQP
jgi:hypothetical protein